MSHAQPTATTKHTDYWGLWNTAAEGSTPHKMEKYFSAVYKYFQCLHLKYSRKAFQFPDLNFPSEYIEDKRFVLNYLKV